LCWKACNAASGKALLFEHSKEHSMATQPNNPFVLPGFGQPGELGQNPLLASMEMMRQAWQNLAGLGGFDTSMMSAALSPEDLERRISDLRAVENWLRMNLSMLSSTIQGMEVQRATVTTLRSFVESAKSTTTTPEGVSPLEAVLGIRRGQPEPKEQASSAARAPPPGPEHRHLPGPVRRRRVRLAVQLARRRRARPMRRPKTPRPLRMNRKRSRMLPGKTPRTPWPVPLQRPKAGGTCCSSSSTTWRPQRRQRCRVLRR
jgi:hypothetical protein